MNRRTWIFVVAAALGAFLFLGADKGDRISPAEGHALVKKGALLLDVRTPQEFASGHAEGAVNIPVEDLGARLSELKGKENSEIVVYCHSGHRAGIAKTELEAKGFTRVHNVGGLSDWNSVKDSK